MQCPESRKTWKTFTVLKAAVNGVAFLSTGLAFNGVAFGKQVRASECAEQNKAHLDVAFHSVPTGPEPIMTIGLLPLRPLEHFAGLCLCSATQTDSACVMSTGGACTGLARGSPHRCPWEAFAECVRCSRSLVPNIFRLSSVGKVA